MRTLPAAACAALVMAPAALAQDDDVTLTVGDAAPAIDIAHWLKGEPVSEFAAGKVYVVEFWATWCGPCRLSMPHISDLQERYADYGVTFIGVSDEPLATVVEFLFEENPAAGGVYNDHTRYSLTCDPDRSVMTDYFQAAGQRGIPCAFIVGKDAHVEWIGHPARIDAALESVVHDRWDRAAFAAEWDAEQTAARRARSVQRRLRDTVMNEEWDAVVECLDELIALGPRYATSKVQRFTVLAGELGRVDEAYVYARAVAFDHWDDSVLLNSLAWTVVDDESIEVRDLEFAHRVAMRASELTDHENASVLDTVARVLFEMGNLTGAIEWQTKAVEHAPEGQVPSLQETLARYLAARAG